MVSATIPAGFPSPTEDHADQGLDLSWHFITRPTSTFLVKVAGCSMDGAGILPGDFLVVDRSRRPRDRDVFLAVVEGDFIVKR